MATEVKTQVETVVSANAKVTALIVAVVSAGVTYTSAKRKLAEGIRDEAKRQGFDKKQASQMVALSYVQAYKMDAQPEAKRNAFILRMRPEVSKVMALAFPQKEKELSEAFSFNDRLKDAPKGERIGENTLLEIARGNLTAKQAIAGKAPKRNGATSKLNGVMTPQERFQNSCAGILAQHKVNTSGHLSPEQATEVFATALAAYLAKK